MRLERTYSAEKHILKGHLILLVIAYFLNKVSFFEPKNAIALIYANILLGAVFSIVCISYVFGVWATALLSATLWMIPVNTIIGTGLYSWLTTNWRFAAWIIVFSAVFSFCRCNHMQAFFSALRNAAAVMLFANTVILPLLGMDLISAASSAQTGMEWIGGFLP